MLNASPALKGLLPELAQNIFQCRKDLKFVALFVCKCCLFQILCLFSLYSKYQQICDGPDFYG